MEARQATEPCVIECVSPATGWCPADDCAEGDVEDEVCEEEISKCGWSGGRKRVSRHIGRDGLGDVAVEMFVSVPSKQVQS